MEKKPEILLISETLFVETRVLWYNSYLLFEYWSPTHCTHTDQWRSLIAAVGWELERNSRNMAQGFELSHLPNWGSSNYSVTVCCMYITTRGAYILFQKKHLYGSRFTNGYDIYTLQISSHHTLVFGHTKHVLRHLMCAKSISHLWVRV